MKKIQKHLLYLFFLIVLTGLLMGCDGSSQSGKLVADGDTGLSPSQETQEPEEEDEELGKVYILKGVNESTQQIVLLKVGGSYREYVLNYNGATVMEDRYGGSLSASTLTYGEVFEIELIDDGLTLKSLKESKNVWAFEGVENFSLNQEDEILKVGNDNYHLSDSTIVFDGVNQFTRAQLTEEDVVTLLGYKKELLSVLIQTGHGTLQLTNTEGFEEGYFVLGNVAAAKITANMTMDVRAGHFLLSVAHGGKGGSQMITITPGQITTVDLSQFAFGATKSSEVTIGLKQEGTIVTINGQEVDTTQPIILTYGTYRIEAELEGYETWSKLLLVSSPTAKIVIDLEDVSNSSVVSDEEEDEDEDEEDNDDEDEDEDVTDEQTNTLINEVMDLLIGD